MFPKADMEKSAKAKGFKPKIKVKKVFSNSKKASAGDSVFSPEAQAEGQRGNGVFINQVIKKSAEVDARVQQIEHDLLQEQTIKSILDQLSVTESLSSSRLSSQSKTRKHFSHNLSTFLASKNCQVKAQFASNELLKLIENQRQKKLLSHIQCLLFLSLEQAERDKNGFELKEELCKS